MAGLFGLSPSEVMQQRNTALQAQAQQYAQLDPLQRAASSMYQAGASLGGAFGGMLGLQDPQLKRAKDLQDISSQFDLTTAEGLNSAARALVAKGYNQEAMEAGKAAQEMKLAVAKVSSEEALAKQRNKEEKAADPFQKLLEKGVYTPASLEAFKLSGKAGDLDFKDSDDKTQLVETDAGQLLINSRTGATIATLAKKPDAGIKFSVDAEELSAQLYNKPYQSLTQEERTKVLDKKLANELASGRARAMSVQLPGVKGAGDLVGLRKDINITVKPFRDAVNSADEAISLADDVLKTGNFASAASLSRALAKAAGETQLSKADVAAFGGDPSFVGSIADIASRLASGTPTADTTRKLKSLAILLKKKNEALEKNEINQLQTTARLSGLYTEDQIKNVFTLRGESKGASDTAEDKEARYQAWKKAQLTPKGF